MKPHDRARLFAALTRTAEVFGKDASGPLLESYWDALRGFSVESVERALKSHEANGKYFPKPAELKTRIQDAGEGAQRRPMAGHETWVGDFFAPARDGVERSQRHWAEEIEKRGAAAKLELLATYEARVSVELREGTPEWLDRMDWARETRAQLMVALRSAP
jgi:hypothetical protein